MKTKYISVLLLPERGQSRSICCIESKFWSKYIKHGFVSTHDVDRAKKTKSAWESNRIAVKSANFLNDRPTSCDYKDCDLLLRICTLIYWDTRNLILTEDALDFCDGKIELNQIRTIQDVINKRRKKVIKK